MDKYRGRERRQSLRMPICAEVKAEFEGRESYFYTRDISSVGALLIAESPPGLGVRLQMTVSFPYVDELVRFQGEVVRHQDYKDKEVYRHIRGFGVRFTGTGQKGADGVSRALHRVKSVLAEEEDGHQTR
jgi:hypothetical protein